MIVNNHAPFDVIAFCSDEKFGYGIDVYIKSGETAKVPGPRDPSQIDYHYKEMMAMEITCHEEPDNNYAYHVSMGHQLCLGNGPISITIRHHTEDRIIKHYKLNCGTEHAVNTESCKKFGFNHKQRVRVKATGKEATILGVSGLPYGMRNQALEIKFIDDEVLWIQVDGDPGICCVLDPDRDLKAI